MFDTMATGALTTVRERSRPVSERRTHLLPVATPLAGLLPDGGLRRGTTLLVRAGAAGGATTLALALVAATSAAGSWCVGVGFPDLGAVAAQELALDLARTAVVPRPGGLWAQVVATLLEEVDVVLLRPPGRVAGRHARQLAARARHRRATLVLVGAPQWPEPPDVVLEVADVCWTGVGPGQGGLRQRLATVTGTARRGDTRPRRARLWLPGPDGTVAPAATTTGAIPTTVDVATATTVDGATAAGPSDGGGAR